MAEPTASNYVAGAALDSNVTLFGDALNQKQFTLNGALSSGATTVPVTASVAALNVPLYILIDSELIYAEATGANQFTSCTRGAGGTSAAAHSSGADVFVIFTALHFNQLKRAIIAIETELGLTPSGASADLATRLGSATAAEFGRLVGVTSAIQTQIDTKAPSSSPTFTGTVTLPKTLEIQDTSATHQYVLAVSELTADRTITLPLLAAADVFVFADFIQTVKNKRITQRTPTVTQSATPTINTDNTDVAHITGLAQAITSMTTNLSGTPVEGDTLRIDFTDSGTGRAITWGASFEASGVVALPTTTVANVRLDVEFIWNTVTSKWRCVRVS